MTSVRSENTASSLSPMLSHVLYPFHDSVLSRALLVSARASSRSNKRFPTGLNFPFLISVLFSFLFGFGSRQAPKCYRGPRAHRAPSFVVISKLLLPTSTRKIESFSFRTHNSLFSLLNSFGIVGIQGSVIFGCGCEIKTKIAAPTGFFLPFFHFVFHSIFFVLYHFCMCVHCGQVIHKILQTTFIKDKNYNL